MIRHWLKHRLGRCYEIRGDGRHDDWRGIQRYGLPRDPGRYLVSRTIVLGKRDGKR